MTVGIVSYLSERGLGNMCHDLRKQLGIDRQLVIPDGNWMMRNDWMNGEEFYLQEWEIQRDDLVAWKQVDNIDTLVSIETGFGDNTFRWAKELGMRTILIAMWESYNPHLPAYQNVDLYICPSWKAFQEIASDNKVFLPYPVDTDEFTYRQRTGRARTFVHNAGSGGMNGRKGTYETICGFLKACEIVPDLRLIIRSQRPMEEIFSGATELLNSQLAYDHIKLEGPQESRSNLYFDGDVLIYVSRYDGHSLVGLEGMSSGMPVITTDAAPMNEYWVADKRLLVKVKARQSAGMVNPHCMANIVDIDDLAQKIIWCATNDIGEISSANRYLVEEQHSWMALRDRWKKTVGVSLP